MNNFLSTSSVRSIARARLRRLPVALSLAATLLCSSAPRVRAQTTGEVAAPGQVTLPDGTVTTFAPSTLSASFKFEADKLVAVSSKMTLILRGSAPCVEVEINGKAALFVIDTGANGNFVTRKAAARLGLKSGTTSGKVRGFGGSKDVMGASIDSLKVGSFVYRDQAVLVYDGPDSYPFDGTLGTPFIALQVMTLDFQNKTLKLTRTEDFVPSKEDAELPLEISESNMPLVRLKLGDKIELFKMDTGNNGSVDLYAPFVERNKLREVYRSTPAAVMGVGGLAKASEARLPNLKVGEFEIAGVVGHFFSQTHGVEVEGKTAGNIGIGIWQRFTLTIDLKNSRFYVRPNALFDAPFRVPNFGALFLGNGKIIEIVPNSPAQEAGLVVGDIITRIEDEPSAQQSPPANAKAAQGEVAQKPSGGTARFKVRSADGKEREVTVTLRDLI